MKLNCFETVELSDIGRKRKNNEDACLRVPDKGVYCVADGMGGAVGGDLASAAIVNRLRKTFIEEPDGQPESFAGHVAAFRQAADDASRWIKEFADDKVISHMGSTVVALIFDPDNPKRAVGLHAGDSRLYRCRDGQLKLLTSDHTAAATLAASLGRDISQIPEKFHNELVKAVGLSDTVELEKTLVDVASGDIYLLCSDGLTRMLPEAEINSVLSKANGAPVDEVAKTLIAKANEAGGKDNITVILVRLGDLSGFSDVFEPVDLDPPRDMSPVALGEEAVTVAESVEARTPDSGQAVHAHTPRTEDSGPMRGDTPQTDDGPLTPPTTPPPREPEPELVPAGPPPEGERVLRKGRLAAAALVLMAIAAVTFEFVLHSGLFKHKEAAPPPRIAVAPAPAPVAKPVVAATGSASIQSKPSGAEVFFNGRKLGVTPFETNGLPAGQAVFDLKTPTHAGRIQLTIAPGQKAGGIATLTPVTGTISVRSDPGGAEVWLDNQNKGRTPLALDLPLGSAQLTLKVNGLKDRALSVDVAAAQTNVANAVFEYGGVILMSEPEGAELSQNGTIYGRTPYTNYCLQTGRFAWQLTAKGWRQTNFTLEVFDHKASQATIHLDRARGLLQLTGNVPGIVVSVDGVQVGTLPGQPVWVDADADHVVTAQYHGQTKTANVRLNDGQSSQLPFQFIEEVTRWTNRFLGMEFVKLPGSSLWAASSRVTLEQFRKVMPGVPNAAKELEDDGRRYAGNLTAGQAREFVVRLNESRAGGGRPQVLDGMHFALPTAQQWMQVFNDADKLGLQMTGFKADPEWCLDGSQWSEAGYLVQSGSFAPTPGIKPFPMPPGPEPQSSAIRLVLTP